MPEAQWPEDMKLTVKQLREVLSTLPDDYTVAAMAFDGAFDIGGFERDDALSEILLLDTERVWLEARRKPRMVSSDA